MHSWKLVPCSAGGLELALSCASSAGVGIGFAGVTGAPSQPSDTLWSEPCGTHSRCSHIQLQGLMHEAAGLEAV